MGKAANSSISLKQIHVTDNFWNKYVHLVKDVIIPYQWDILNDKLEDVETSHCIENFKIAAGEKEGEFQGAVFQDTDVAKWLEAVGFVLNYERDEKLEELADETIELIGRAQQPDGYLNTYFTIKEPDGLWSNLMEGHELYTAGHMIEAAVAYYEATGKRRFLEIVSKFADLVCQTFGPEEGKIHGYPGHQEIELALVKLYRVTREKKYLDLAKYFIDLRGTGKNYFLEEEKRPGHKQTICILQWQTWHMNIRIKNYSRHAETCGIIWCTKECILQEVLDLLDSWNDLQQIMICQMTAIILRHVLRLHLLCLEREWQIWRRMLLIWM